MTKPQHHLIDLFDKIHEPLSQSIPTSFNGLSLDTWNAFKDMLIITDLLGNDIHMDIPLNEQTCDVALIRTFKKTNEFIMALNKKVYVPALNNDALLAMFEWLKFNNLIKINEMYQRKIKSDISNKPAIMRHVAQYPHLYLKAGV